MFSTYNTLRGIALTNFGRIFRNIKKISAKSRDSRKFPPVATDEIPPEIGSNGRRPHAAPEVRSHPMSETREFTVYLQALTRKPQR